MTHQKLFIFTFLSFSCIFSACEYERVTVASLCNENPITISIDQSSSTLAVDCGAKNASLVLMASGGSSFLEYSINQSPFAASNTFSNLGAGTYSIIARDVESQCESDPLIVEVVNEGGISISLDSKQEADCGVASGVISVLQSDGVAPIQYQLDNGAFQDSNSFNQLLPGTYNITAKDANGCEATLNNISISSGVSLSEDIQLIINTNCAVTGCHNNAQSPNLNNLQGIIDNASRIRSRTSSGSMPPSGREDLTQQEIDLIACWVEDGALNN